MPTATQLGELAMLYGTPTDYMVFGMRTIPVSMLTTARTGTCRRLAKMMEGYRALVLAIIAKA